MAYQVTRKPISDVDGKSEAVEQHYVLDGDGGVWQVDVSKAEAETLSKARGTFVGKGVKVTTLAFKGHRIETEMAMESAPAPVVSIGTAPSRARTGGGTSRPGNRVRNRPAGSGGNSRTQRIREWGRAQGETIQERGKLPNGLEERYNAAHPQDVAAQQAAK